MAEVVGFEDGEVVFFCCFEEYVFHLRYWFFGCLHAVDVADDCGFYLVEDADLFHLVEEGVAVSGGYLVCF